MKTIDIIMIIVSVLGVILSILFLVIMIFSKLNGTCITRIKKVGSDKIKKYKEKLKKECDPEECAEKSWLLVSCGGILTPISSNSRKPNYSDKVESNRFCSSLNENVVKKLDELENIYG